MKFTAKYKKGFREGYNNPTRHKGINLSHPKANDEYIAGIIAGVCARYSDIQKGDNSFIWSDEDLNKKVR